MCMKGYNKVSARDESETDKEIILRMTTIVDKITDYDIKMKVVTALIFKSILA